MKVSNKLNRVAALIAAAAILLAMLSGMVMSAINMISLAESMSVSNMITNLLSLVISVVYNLLIIFVLVRGKKDKAAAALVGILMLQILLTGVVKGLFTTISSFSMVLSNPISVLQREPYIFCMALGNLILLCASAIMVLFRGMIAFECFKPGKISGGMLRWALVAIALLAVGLNVAYILVFYFYLALEYAFTNYLISMCLPLFNRVIWGIGTILLSVAFAIPVYEKELPECEDCQQAEEATEEVTEAE